MKTCVIGSRGFIGRRLVSALREVGHPVVECSTSFGNGLDPETGLLVPSFELPSDVDAVVYLAQSPHYRAGQENKSHLFRVNAISAFDVAERAARMGALRFIYASTGSVYQASFAPLDESAALNREVAYPLSKIHGEELLRFVDPSLEVIRIRLFGVYGPNQKSMLVSRLASLIEAGEPVVLTPAPGEGVATEGLRISLCFVDDLVRIVIALAQGGGPAILNVGGPEATTIRELSEMIGHFLGKKPAFRVDRKPRDTDLVADISRLTKLLSPAFTSLTRGIEATVVNQSRPVDE